MDGVMIWQILKSVIMTMVIAVVMMSIKGLVAYLLRSPKPLPADLKNRTYELAQIWGQIFGVPLGTKEAHEIKFEISQIFLRLWGRFAIYLRILMHFRKKFTK